MIGTQFVAKVWNTPGLTYGYNQLPDSLQNQIVSLSEAKEDQIIALSPEELVHVLESSKKPSIVYFYDAHCKSELCISLEASLHILENRDVNFIPIAFFLSEKLFQVNQDFLGRIYLTKKVGKGFSADLNYKQFMQQFIQITGQKAKSSDFLFYYYQGNKTKITCGNYLNELIR